MQSFPHLKPINTLIPLIAEAATSPYDTSSKRIQDALGKPLSAKLAQNWENTPAAQRRKLLAGQTKFGKSKEAFENRLWLEAMNYVKRREEMARTRSKIIKGEVARAMQAGIYGYVPSPTVAQNAGLMYEINKSIADIIRPATCCICCCDEKEDVKPAPSSPPPTKKYGVQIDRIKCGNTESNLGGDELYFLAVAVDGNNNNVVTTTQPLINLNDEQEAMVSHWIYPPKDPGGMIDIAIHLYENDGGYGDVAEAIVKLGGSVATIPDPWGASKIAGAVLAVVGGLTGLINHLDNDDDLGLHLKNWTGPAQLDAAVGAAHMLNYYDGDAGWDDWSDWNYDVTLKVVSV